MWQKPGEIHVPALRSEIVLAPMQLDTQNRAELQRSSRQDQVHLAARVHQPGLLQRLPHARGDGAERAGAANEPLQNVRRPPFFTARKYEAFPRNTNSFEFLAFAQVEKRPESEEDAP